MGYDVRTLNFDYYHTWNLIIGVQYVTVGSYGYKYGEVIEQLSGEMEIKKPLVLLSFNQMRVGDYNTLKEFDTFDYEFGV